MITFFYDTDKTLEFEIVLTEQYENNSTITSHPIEKGSKITDHVNLDNTKVSFDAFISNTPVGSVLFDKLATGAIDSVSKEIDTYFLQNKNYEISIKRPPAQANVASLIRTLIPQQNTVSLTGKEGVKAKQRINYSVLQFEEAFDLRKLYLAALDKLRNDRTLIRVVTPVLDLENCLIASVKSEITNDTGASGLQLSIELEQVTIVETKLVAAPKPTEKRANKKTDAGNKGSTNGTKKEGEDSILYYSTANKGENVKKFIGGLFP